MSPLGWHPSHLVTKTDSQDLGTSIDNSVGFLAFFFCVSIFCLCQSLYLSLCLFTINLKFLKTHYHYWLSQVVYVSFVLGLTLKKCKLRIKMLKNSSKTMWGRHYWQGFSQNSHFSKNQSSACFIGPVCSIVLSACPVISLSFCLFCLPLNNHIGNISSILCIVGE